MLKTADLQSLLSSLCYVPVFGFGHPPGIKIVYFLAIKYITILLQERSSTLPKLLDTEIDRTMARTKSTEIWATQTLITLESQNQVTVDRALYSKIVGYPKPRSNNKLENVNQTALPSTPSNPVQRSSGKLCPHKPPISKLNCSSIGFNPHSNE